MAIPQTDLQKIVNTLNTKGVSTTCPSCKRPQMQVVADGYFSHMVTDQLGGAFTIGGPTIPTVGLICGNCGHLAQYALGTLGLLPK